MLKPTFAPPAIASSVLVRFGQRLLLALMLVAGFAPRAMANDLRISNVALVNQDLVDGHVLVQFDLAWNNSWRLPPSLAAGNWDAAWVFVKFRTGFVDPDFTVASASSGASTLTVSSTQGLRVGMPLRITAGSGSLAANTVISGIDSVAGTISLNNPTTSALSAATLTASRIWESAWLNDAGHNGPTGISLQGGLRNESSAFNTSSNPVLGVYVYRSEAGSGDLALTGLQCRWNYRAQGLTDEEIIDIRVFGVELVHLPEGAFWVGSGGSESNSFTAANSSSGATVPFLIGSSAPTMQGTDPASDANNLGARGATDLSGTATASLAGGFPTGHDAFYAMKYELSQQQYVDFLNVLTRDQQDERTATALPAGSSSITNRYVMSGGSSLSFRNGIRCDATVDAELPLLFYCDLDGNGTGGEATDGKALACNYLSWADLAAYADWAGMRPMSELEFEKAARGTRVAVADAYAWGNSSASAATGLSNAGSDQEIASNGGANAHFGNEAGIGGPMRVGSFAQLERSRAAAGAGFYGMPDLSGNLWERCVTAGNASGRAFDGAHGDGQLAPNGRADVPNWPGNDAVGSGLRGGDFSSALARLAASDRERAAEAVATRENNTGGRAARHQPTLTPILGNL